jgi:hypothetical protein
MHHCPGRENIVADSLSRALSVVNSEVPNSENECPFLNNQQVQQRQRADREIQLLIKALDQRNRQVCPKGVSYALWSVRKKLKMINGTLVLMDEGESRWIIPYSLRRQSLQLVHSFSVA